MPPAAAEHALVQGGHDVLAASQKDFELLCHCPDYEALSKRKAQCAKVLCAFDGPGPKQACALAKQFDTFGAIADHYHLSDPQKACQAIAQLQTSTGRKVGPAAAKKLLFYLTCEKADAVFDGA
jgi:hypothetical protein